MLLTLVLALGLLGSGIPAFADPVPDDAVHISTPAQLKALADAVNDPATNAETVDKHYVLDNDIDLGGYPNWTPIGTYSQAFNATFDGQGHTVSGMKISLSGSTNNSVAGLFGRAAGTVENFTIEGTISSTINNINMYIGGAVGYAGGIDVENGVEEPSPENPYIGSRDALTVRNIKSRVDIGANVGYLGGIVGYSLGGYLETYTDPDWEEYTEEISPTTIEGCTNSGSLTSNSSTWIRIGGICGVAASTDVSGCYNTGALSITARPTTYCYVGGVVATGTTSNIADSFNIGAISNSGGAVTQAYFGGVISINLPTAGNTVTNCHYLDTSYPSDPSGATSKSADELASPDFLTLINNGGNAFKAGISHPVLAWESDGDDGGSAPVTISISNGSGSPGDDGVDLTLKIEHALEPRAMEVYFRYDYTQFELVSVDSFSPRGQLETLSPYGIVNDVQYLAFYSNDDYDPFNPNGEPITATLHFRIKAGAVVSDTPYEIQFVPEYTFFYTGTPPEFEDYAAVPFDELRSGFITVTDDDDGDDGDGGGTTEPETYAVDIASGLVNGTVASDRTSAAAGETVTLTVVPSSGYVLRADSLKVNDGAVPVGGSANIYTFVMPEGAVTVTAQFETGPTSHRYVVFSADSPVAARVNGSLVSFVPANGGNITFTLEPLAGYEVTKVYTDTAEITPSGSGVYTLFGANEHTVVFIDTKDKWTSADKILYTADDLFAFRAEVEAGNSYAGKVVRLGSDIDLTGKGWTLAIGQSRDTAFCGTFDGDGYTLTLDGAGLFRRAFGAVIKNLNTDGNASTPAIVGSEAFSSAVINCKNRADIIGSVGMVSQISYADFINTPLPEPYVGIYRCINYGSVTAIQGNGSGAAASGGVGIYAQRMIKCGNEGTITSGVSNSITTNALGSVYGSSPGSAYAPGMLLDRCYNTGLLYVIHSSYAAAILGLVVTNSYSSGDIIVDAGHVASNPLDPAHINGVIGLLLVKDTYVTGERTIAALDIKTGIDLSGVYMQKYAVQGVQLIGASNNTYSHATNPPTVPLSGAFATDGKLAWQVAAPKSYTVTFSEDVTIGGVTSDVFTLPVGTYGYTTATGLTRSFNHLSEGRYIDIDDALVDVEFDVSPAGATLVVTDAAGNVVSPVDTYAYRLAEGVVYTYTATAEGYVGVGRGFVATGDTDTVAVRLALADATVDFVTVPEDASVTVTDAAGATVVPAAEKSYALKAGATYSYVVGAVGYTDSFGTFTAATRQSIPVTLEQGRVTVTFAVTPSGATVVVKRDGEAVLPTLGKTYLLDEGQSYTWEVGAIDYVGTEGTLVADRSKTVNVNLSRVTVPVRISVTPTDATVEVRSPGGSVFASGIEGGIHTFNLGVGMGYEYTAYAEGYAGKVALFSVGDGALDIDVTLSELAVGTPISGDFDITEGGTYVIERGVNDATVTVYTTEPVTIAGTGVAAADIHNELEIAYAVDNADLTVRDLYVRNALGATASGETGAGRHIVDFAGGANTLVVGNTDGSGMCLFDQDGYIRSAAIHVPSASSLTMSAPGTLYMYKRSQGAGIGGDSYEATGDIVFTSGQLFIKGSKTGALIGGDAGAAGVTLPGSAAVNGDITIAGGEVVLIAKAQGAIIGASHLGTCAGDVYLTGGNLTVISDFNAGLGRGGGSDAPAGTINFLGGSFKAVRTPNSYFAIGDDPSRAANGVSFPAFADDALVTAEMLDAEGAAARLLTFDTSALLTEPADTFEVVVDDSPFYTGGLHRHTYTESGGSTLANFGADGTDPNLYLYLGETDHSLSVNGERFTVSWDSDAQAFTVAKDDGSEEKVGAPGSGDYDGDGHTTIDEALLLVQLINNDALGTLSEAQFAALDIDGNGELTMADALLIVQIVLKAA